MISPKKVLSTHLQSLPPKVIDHISPSQLGKCPRAHYYKIKHIEPLITPSESALANFQVGFLWEQLIKEALEGQKIPFTFQDEWYDPELNMKGSSDFIITEDNGEKTMWDSKTMASKWFWYRESKRKRGQYDWYEENHTYIIQQGAYLLMAKRLGWNVTKSILVFISKDDGFIGEQLEVYLTPKLEAELMERIKAINDALRLDEPPRCTCEGWLTGYCDMGRPATMEKNKTKKLVATECCPDSIEEIEEWRKEAQKETA